MNVNTTTRAAADLQVGDTLTNGSQVAMVSHYTSGGVVHITWTSGATTAYVRPTQKYRVKV